MRVISPVANLFSLAPAAPVTSTSEPVPSAAQIVWVMASGEITRSMCNRQPQQ